MRSTGRSLTLAGLRWLVCLGAAAAPALALGAPRAPAADSAACAFDTLVFDADFPGGRLDACTARADGSYELRFDPEDRPINASPWYAFRVSPTRPGEVLVHLTYGHHGHRYWPKLSADGEHWQRAAIGAVSIDEDKGAASLRLHLTEEPLWVAGQELIDNEDYRLWAEALAAGGVFALSRLGQSAQGRDIVKLEHAADSRRYIALIGRQHPPEVSGALGLMHFVERLAEDDELARRFRRHFGILVIPNMNPDGVALGHWRHNTGGVDLNRDWGPFTQPETVLVRDELARFGEGSDETLFLFLDFHSTRYDVLYTQPADQPTRPRNFTGRWIEGLQRALSAPFPGYPVTVKPGHYPDVPTSKTYMHASFGAPAITFELGDETDREFVRRYARTAAQQAMLELLRAP